MKRNKRRVIAGILAFIMIFLGGKGLAIVLAATLPYPGFDVEDTLSIRLEGTVSGTHTDKTYTLDELVGLYQGCSPDLRIIDKTYELYAAQNLVYADNLTTIGNQMTDYLSSKALAEAGADPVLASYYQSLYQQAYEQKASIEHEKEINQYYIDHSQTLKQEEKRRLVSNFAKQVFGLISLKYQDEYLDKVLQYQLKIVEVQKVKLDKQKILPSEYELALSDVGATQSEIETTKLNMQSIAKYIRTQTGLAESQNITITFNLKNLKTMTNSGYNGLVEVIWSNNQELQTLDTEILAKAHLRTALASIYSESSNQGQLTRLEIEKLNAQRDQKAMSLELQKNDQKTQFAILNGNYASALEKTKKLDKKTYESHALYEIGLLTEMDRLKGEIDQEKSILELYQVIQQLLSIEYFPIQS